VIGLSHAPSLSRKEGEIGPLFRQNLGEVEHPAGRILRLLELLQTYGRVGGPELASRLDVDRRTVRRYVGTLQELGIPVVADRGRAGGYRLRPGFKLPPLMLSDAEALAVSLGLLAVRRFGLLPGDGGVDGALAKLGRVLPEALRERLRASKELFSLPPGRGSVQPSDPGVLLTLAEAARAYRRVCVRYRAWRGETSERSVDPYGLVFQGGRWYLAGRDHLREAVRVFRLDRVLEARLEAVGFERPEGFDAAVHVQRALARVPWAWPVEVLLDAEAEEARRLVPEVVGSLEPAPGGVLLRLRAERLEGAARYLASLPCRFTVVAPLELRQELRRLADRLAAS
jgi:predicted DNA-binding transcriptional regulator YafY